MAMKAITPEQRKRVQQLVKRLRTEWDNLTPEQRKKLIDALRAAGLAAGEIVRRRRGRGGGGRRRGRR
jgi:hypothetical protein